MPEKRLYPRIDHTLPVNIIANGYDFATATQNISCYGAYCRLEKYIPPFTKIMIRLKFPDTKYEFECKGVVVRSEDDKNSGFNIAIFFNEIKESQRHKISEYLSQFLPK